MQSSLRDVPIVTIRYGVQGWDDCGWLRSVNIYSGKVRFVPWPRVHSLNAQPVKKNLEKRKEKANGYMDLTNTYFF